MFLALLKSRHFYNVLGYFVVASAIVIGLGVVASETTLFAAPAIKVGGFLSAAIAAGIIGATALLFGFGSTIGLRSIFRQVTGEHIQTGRIIQYTCFYIGTCLGLSLAALLTAFAAAYFWLTALLIFAIAFGGATLTGEIPTRGRTWLPSRMQMFGAPMNHK